MIRSPFLADGSLGCLITNAFAFCRTLSKELSCFLETANCPFFKNARIKCFLTAFFGRSFCNKPFFSILFNSFVQSIFPISGFKKRWAHTKAETGLPGSPTKIVLLFFPAKIGFPGLMATL